MQKVSDEAQQVDRNISKRQFSRLLALSQTLTEERANASARSSRLERRQSFMLDVTADFGEPSEKPGACAEPSRGVDHR